MDKTIIYQLFPRWFTNLNENCVANGTISQNGVGKFNDIDARILMSIKKLGITHVWYTGIIEQATKSVFPGIEPCNPHVVKGNAGSPYAIRDYYDVSPELAVNIDNRINEFCSLVERTHDAGMKVIIDFVPNHVARQYKSDAKPNHVKDLGSDDNTQKFFDPNNNFYYITDQAFTPNIDLGSGDDAYHECPAKATGNDCWNASPGINDWYETVKINYGVDPWNGSKHFNPIPRTWHQMLDIMRFWCSKGIDGLRCDMVHMVPVEFWHWAIAQIKHEFPQVIFIAEIYDTQLYRSYINEGGFDFLYNKVTLYDTLFNIVRHGNSTQEITKCWQAVDDIKRHMLNFIENHDEVRAASDFFACNAPKALPAMAVCATIASGPTMIYAGQELGERAEDAEGFSGHDGRTTIFDYWSVPSIRKWLQRKQLNGRNALRDYYKKLLNICLSEKAIACGELFDLMYVNQHLNRQYVFIRHFENDILLIATNFDAATAKCDINIPRHAFETIGLKEGTYQAHDIMHGTTGRFTLSSSEQVAIEVGGYDTLILKLKKI